MMGAMQAALSWARDKNGMIPDHLWTDPFSKMRLKEDDPEGGPFEPDELHRLFEDVSRRDGVDFWLPIVALYTGARRSELTGLQAGDVTRDEDTGYYMLAIHEDPDAGSGSRTKDRRGLSPYIGSC